MGKITHHLHAEIDLSQDPILEIGAVIAAVLQAYPGKEHEILTKLKGEIQHTIDHYTKEADKRGKTVPETRRSQ